MVLLTGVFDGSCSIAGVDIHPANGISMTLDRSGMVMVVRE